LTYIVFSKNLLSFKHYNPKERILGKTMKDWLRFSVCYWHTFRGTGADPFGVGTIKRSWDDGTQSLENALRRVRAAFEFMSKLGVEYYTFHDRDVSPEGPTIEETEKNLDVVSDLLLEMQNKYGIKLLWGTANLFTNPIYMNGAMTNPDVHVFAHAAAQVIKALEITHKLGGGNFVFWGGREGYHSVLNTDVRKELDHMAHFLKMARNYKNKLNSDIQLLIEPKPREPTKHQYDYDAGTVIGFLKTYGLDKDFKLNIEPNHTTLAGHDFEHDILIASKYGMLGSIDSNTGDPLLGWDTDQFPSDVKKTTLTMKYVIEMGGLSPGGLNFDAKLRRESTDLEDMFIAHIGAMDCFARGLRNAARIIEDKVLDGMVADRYSSFKSESLGQKVEEGKATLEELAKYAKANGKPKLISGKQEKYEMIFNQYV